MAEAGRPARVEVDRAALRHNVGVLAAAAGGAELCAVVKANGYGHGAVEVARTCLDAGVSRLAVALVGEGEELRAAGITAPILLLSEPPPAQTGRLLEAGLTPTVYTPQLADALAGTGAEAHVLVDTGMNRVGVPAADWPRLAARLAATDGLTVTGLWTHLACADEPHTPTTGEQLATFRQAVADARDAGLDPRTLHAANSAGTLLFPDTHLDMVRPGIAVYGLSPAPGVPATDHDLRQALRLTADVTFVKHVPAGTPVSYGHTWRAPEPGFLATLPLGYADGVPRSLSNRADVLIGGRRRPLAGTVCMDQVLVWCADHEPAPGDEAVLLGRQGDARIPVDEWAELHGTISYEIATGLTPRLPREHV